MERSAWRICETDRMHAFWQAWRVAQFDGLEKSEKEGFGLKGYDGLAFGLLFPKVEEGEANRMKGWGCWCRLW